MPTRKAEKSSTCERDRLTAWLRGRLTGEKARGEWRHLLESSWDQVMTMQVEEVCPQEAMIALALSHVTPERLADLLRPAVRVGLPLVVERMREDKKPLGRWVPDPARKTMRRMLAQPGLVHGDWVRAVFRQDAVKALMNDALYRGIREFSTALPRIILGLLPTSRLPGLGGAGLIGKRILEELEAKLEPEIKAFLAGGTDRVLAQAAEVAIRRIDDQSSVKLRTEMVDFTLEKSPAFHAAAFKEENVADFEKLVEAVARRVAELDDSKRLAREIVEQLAGKYGKRRVGNVLAEIGVEGRPDFDAWAEATWPALRGCVETLAVQTWAGEIMDELLAELAQGEKPAKPVVKAARGGTGKGT